MKIYQDFEMMPLTNYKIGGRADYLLEVSSTKDIQEAVEFIKKNSIKKVLVIGQGTNLLFPEKFEGAVIRIIPNNMIHLANENSVEAFAGESLDSVIQFGFQNNLIGLEWAGGLPGTVGAAVRGNVGAFGGEIKDAVKSAEVFDKESLELKTFTNPELLFSYRNSIIKQNKNLIVISAVFDLKKSTSDELLIAQEVYKKNIEYRKNRHPLEYPNSGSVFKNISKKEDVAQILQAWPDIREKAENDWHGKVSMGYIIGRLGMAGFTIGGAQVSEKHQNYIINLGEAHYNDVTQIIETIKQKIHDTFGFVPEVEIEIVAN